MIFYKRATWSIRHHNVRKLGQDRRIKSLSQCGRFTRNLRIDVSWRRKAPVQDDFSVWHFAILPSSRPSRKCSPQPLPPSARPNVLTLSCKAAYHAGLTTAWWLPRLTLASEGAMCSHHDAMQLEPPTAAPPPSQRSAALAACERSWAAT